MINSFYRSRGGMRSLKILQSDQNCQEGRSEEYDKNERDRDKTDNEKGGVSIRFTGEARYWGIQPHASDFE